ncbi:MAG TPA: GMC family oxidoreductase N-terminal domain-containing protein [Acidimicrobiia bacterium]|nr:GMC family oxidoreductase N-terminal domain-containing protein [Acidimicrobiia bacterium]
MYDHVIVGAGSAGCVLASRLSADPRRTVLLLEAGGPDRRREIGIPAAFSKLFHTDFDWDYRTVPQPQLSDRTLFWPRGRGLGGSSSISAMMWVRGVPADYDAWEAAGNAGWSYRDVLTYFKRSEDAVRRDSAHSGIGGPVRIEEQRDPNPGTHLFVAACQRAGIPRNANANAETSLGVDYTQVFQRRGRRVSSADAYLHPVRDRPNLVVETGARVVRVVLEAGRVTGVSYLIDGELRTVRARGDVVLAGGAVNTPQILMLSGIGPADHLAEVGIDPVVDLPGVGGNLSDHLAAGLMMATSRTDSLVVAERPAEIVKYLAARRGLLSSNVGEAHAFLQSRSDLAGPDIELIFAPVPFLDHGDTNPDGHGYTIGVVLLQPASRGTIRLASADPFAAPLIDPRYLQEEEDLATLLWGVERAEEVFGTEPLAGVITDPIRPVRPPETTQDRIEGIRTWSETLYHPAGTAAMGVHDAAVVDPQLRVRGVEGLRIADASVMPTLNRGHTHAPVVMIGEKAAELILAG